MSFRVLHLVFKIDLLFHQLHFLVVRLLHHRLFYVVHLRHLNVVLEDLILLKHLQTHQLVALLKVSLGSL